MISRDHFTAHVIAAAHRAYPHVPWSVEYNRGTDSLELWACFSKVDPELIAPRMNGAPRWKDVRCVSWALWLIAADDFDEVRLAYYLESLDRDLEHMLDIAAGNRTIRRRKEQRRLEGWRRHFGILAEVVECSG